MSEASFRFGVGGADEPRSSIWRLWVPKGKSDVYLGARAVAGLVKVSLHASGQCHIGLAFEYARKRGVQPAKRIWEHWSMPPTGSGYSVPLRLFFPIASLRDGLPSRGTPQKPLHWITPPADAPAIEFACVFTAAPTESGNWPGRTKPGSTPIVSINLPSGKQFWLVAYPSHISDEASAALDAGQSKLRSLARQTPTADLAAARGFFFGDAPEGGRMLTEFAGDEVHAALGTESDSA